MVLLSFLIVEMSFRIILAFKVGPRIVLYGTAFYRNENMVDKMKELKGGHTVMWHENISANYSKYFPNEIKTDTDQDGKLFKATINRYGFRGKDYDVAKRPDVVRIVTLGASSTFGYNNRDNDTYPHVMEEILNKDCSEARYEVINLGIPHMRSENIRSLFFGEALTLNPDIVTFYEGMNDTVSMAGLRGKIVNIAVKGTKESIFLRKMVDIYAVLRDKIVLVFFLENSLVYFSDKTFSTDDFNYYLQGKSDKFLKNLSEIKDECAKRGILFIVANQQSRSLTPDMGNIKGISYQGEVEHLRQKLQGEGVNIWELRFLIHASMMSELKKWALSNNISFVDVIKALDDDRDFLLSWVHVNHKGNRIIAKAFADEILKQTCRRGPK